MNWAKPEFEEIRLCCEINSYACAKLDGSRTGSACSSKPNRDS